MKDEARERRGVAGERCTGGRQAAVVFGSASSKVWGEVGWCGRSDGGRRGRAVFCAEPAGHPEERCPLSSPHPDPLVSGSVRPDPGPISGAV